MSNPPNNIGFQVKSGVRGGNVCERAVSPGVLQTGMWFAPDGSGDLLFADVSMTCDDPQYSNSAYGTMLDSGGNVTGVFQYKWGNNMASWMLARANGGGYTSGSSTLSPANDDNTWAVANRHGVDFYGLG